MKGERGEPHCRPVDPATVDPALDRLHEELLEALWTREERGSTRREDVAAALDVPLTDELVKGARERDWVEERPDGSLSFTLAGRERARGVIRRHRLAERLVRDILAMPLPEMEANACEFEHLVAEGITESICTLLGHPGECPHGRPIPEGRCCIEARKSVESVVVSVEKMFTGEAARVAYLNTKNYPRLQKLSSFGITPGTRVRVHQRSPALVLECDETQVAVEAEVARDIFVFREP
jgi:DtxR family Mn-dependent transcriptional regulator